MKRYLSLRFNRMLSEAEASALAADARAAGWRLELRRNERFARTYALLSAEDENAGDASFSGHREVSRWADSLIALSIEADAAEGLVSVVSALTGEGAPDGILCAEVLERDLLVEFLPARTSWRLVRALIDVELERYGSRVRRTTLLSPLAPRAETHIAADGLQEPELDESRVLEALLGDADR